MSSEAEYSFTPSRLTAPQLGFSANTPQNDAGRMVEPAVWVPSASGTCQSATAAADPAEEPPGDRAGSSGCRVAARRPAAANSVVSVLPRMMAPALRSVATAAASSAGR